MARQSFFTRSQIVAIPIPWKIWKGIGERSNEYTYPNIWPVGDRLIWFYMMNGLFSFFHDLYIIISQAQYSTRVQRNDSSGQLQNS